MGLEHFDASSRQIKEEFCLKKKGWGRLDYFGMNSMKNDKGSKSSAMSYLMYLLHLGTTVEVLCDDRIYIFTFRLYLPNVWRKIDIL